MIKQKYGSKFFIESYPMCGYKMFEKYYKRLEDQYRFFIIVQHNYYDSTYSTTDVYRSNNTLENIIEQLDNMNFQCVTITDFRAEFPQAYKYTYYKIGDMQYITAHYMLRNSESVQMYKSYLSYRKANKSYKGDGNFYWKKWNKYTNGTIMEIFASEHIEVTYDNIKMVCDKNGETYAYQFTLVNSPKVKINTDHLDKIKKVLKLIEKDNVNGFYDDTIERIKSSFCIFEN